MKTASSICAGLVLGLSLTAGSAADAGPASATFADAVSRAEGLEGLSRALALTDIASAQAAAGDQGGAVHTANLATEPEKLPQDPVSRAIAWSRVGTALALAGEIILAEDVHKYAVEIAQGIANPDVRAMALWSVVRGQAEAGDIVGSLRTFELAAGAGGQAKGPGPQAIMALIAESMAKVGETENGLVLAADIADPRHRAQALSAIAVVLARAENAQQAARAIEDALAAAGSAPPGDETRNAVLVVAANQARTGDVTGARQTYLSVNVPGNVLDPYRVTALLTAIARAEGEAWQDDKAGESIERALDNATRIDDSLLQVRALADIAVAQAAAADFDGAPQTIAKALNLASSMTEPEDGAKALAATALAMKRVNEVCHCVE